MSDIDIIKNSLAWRSEVPDAIQAEWRAFAETLAADGDEILDCKLLGSEGVMVIVGTILSLVFNGAALCSVKYARDVNVPDRWLQLPPLDAHVAKIAPPECRISIWL